jgi:hypothetical protein
MKTDPRTLSTSADCALAADSRTKALVPFVRIDGYLLLQVEELPLAIWKKGMP